MAVIDVVLGDITIEDVDAVVIAANESLLGGSGSMARSTGRLARAGAAIAPCLPGEAKATLAFALDPPIRYVFHTVGPAWEGGHADEADIPASCYDRCLAVANDLGVTSIAFSAIATGAYGNPTPTAARIAP